MESNVEPTVENQLAAARLPAAHKPIWACKINIKAILDEDRANSSLEHIASVSNRIAMLLREQEHLWPLGGWEDDCCWYFRGAVALMESCTIASLAEEQEGGVAAVEMFNGWLKAIYDWANANRVWLGA